jgi:hypothetical protein
MLMAASKAKKKLDLSEAVKRMDSSLKRETGTPPKPYHAARQRKEGKPPIPLSRRPKGASLH